MNSRWITAATLALTLTLALKARADEEPLKEAPATPQSEISQDEDLVPWAASINTGFNMFTDGSGSAQGQFGGALSYKFSNHYETGIQVDFGGTFAQYGLELNYVDSANYWGGVQAGPVNFGNAAGYAWGPQIGYDYDIGSEESVGLEAQYQFISFTSGTGPSQNKTPSFISLFAVLTKKF